MRFVHTLKIPADRARVWQFLMDVPRVARCVPGVDSVEAIGENTYRGILKLAIGPIRLALAGDVSVNERDADAGVASMSAKAADARAGGAVEAEVRMVLTPGASPAESVLTIESDVKVLGRIGEFGQPIIKRKADQTMAEFGANLQRAIAAPA